MKLFNFFTLLLFFGLTSLFATEYRVDQANSLVTFKIRHAVIAKVEGKFNTFSGTYGYNDELHYFTSFEGEAQMASVDTDNKYRDDHLKSKVFDIAKYPTMRLKLIKQDGNKFTADLTIKEMTKRIDFTVSLVPKSRNKFYLMGTLSRKAFDLNFSDTAEVGGLVVGDKVEINIIFAGV